MVTYKNDIKYRISLIINFLVKRQYGNKQLVLYWEKYQKRFYVLFRIINEKQYLQDI